MKIQKKPNIQKIYKKYGENTKQYEIGNKSC